MADTISQAVLAREEVVRYLRGEHGENPETARVRVHAYLKELRTRQRYHLYRFLKYPVYPLLRHVPKHVEHVERAVEAARAGRVMYASNHKSHTDYLVQPIVIDDAGIRAPVIAAGINLFGGMLGLVNRHVTGAVPIRRGMKDQAYLITLKAYVAELLRRHDILFYPEGGRSYSGELKPPKTGLIHAAMQAGINGLAIVPVAISYDLVLEDRILSRQGVKRRQRPFTAELVEMTREAFGYRSRVFVTFGHPIPTANLDPQSRRDVLDFAQAVLHSIGRLYKVTPTAVVATAMRPGSSRRDLEARADELVARLRDENANLSVESGRQAVDEGVPPLVRRGVLAADAERVRVKNRQMLRYYARTIDHLTAPRRGAGGP